MSVYRHLPVVSSARAWRPSLRDRCRALARELRCLLWCTLAGCRGCSGDGSDHR